MEEKKLPAEYIRQPYPITAFQADLSIRQIRILAAMMKGIQDGVRKMFKQKAETRQVKLFPDLDAGYIYICVPFREVTDRSDTYVDVERVARKFMDMVFRYDDKQKGEITLTHFVDEISIPKPNGRRETIRFKFSQQQANVIFNFTMYSRYLMPVVMSAKSKYTARIYMLMTSAQGFKEKNSSTYSWYVGYDELRRIFGCDVKQPNGRWCRKTRKDYRHFKLDVLQVAQNELKKLADEGISDCWFDYKESPEDYIKEPKSLVFTIHLVEEEKALLNSNIIKKW